MNSKRLEYRLIFILFCGYLFISTACGIPYNGDFELYDYNEITGLNDPVGWNKENYVTVVQHFIPAPTQGETTNWMIDTEIGLYPFEGSSLLVLSSGDSSINYGKAWQCITIGEGDKLTGVYFFGTCDWNPYNDWAEIKLVPVNNPSLSTILIAYADVVLIGTYGSFGGWTRFEYTFDANEAGDYNLVLGVNDYSDKVLESYLVVDGMVLCQNNQGNPPPEKGDFNCDCTVNFGDFAILANDWLYDCNNPIMYNDGQGRPWYYDPNCNCLLGTDINKNGPVDFNDLEIMLDYWLQGISQQLYENHKNAGDFNLDGTVNFQDFAFWATDWLYNCSDPNTNCRPYTDLTRDGIVDANDLWIIAENWLMTIAPQ